VYNFDSNSTKATGLRLEGAGDGRLGGRWKVEGLGERCISIGITIIVCSSHSNRNAPSPRPKNPPCPAHCIALFCGLAILALLALSPPQFLHHPLPLSLGIHMEMARADVECQ